MQSAIVQRILFESIDRAYDRGHRAWTGCDWPTTFGKSGLDLNGMTSHQALLMARATGGEEAADWREAVRWLRLVESDAEAAETEATSAVGLAARGDVAAAERAAQAACDLEARYHSRPVWLELREVLDTAYRAV